MVFNQQKREDVDIIMKTMEALLAGRPDQPFVKSLHYQYLERGSLSRKQLEGLLGKAQRVPSIPPNWVATLEAIIKKMPVREKAEANSAVQPLYTPDEAATTQLQFVLKQFPQHKQALAMQVRLQQQHSLTPQERKDLERFYALAVKKASE